MYDNRTVIPVKTKITVSVVEKCANFLGQHPSEHQLEAVYRGISTTGNCSAQAVQACSACAGDYVDPDRTAWTADEDDQGDNEEKSAEQTREEEFSDEE